MTYSQLLDKLFHINLHSGSKLGLSNMEELSRIFHHPHKSYKTIHVAGTNGKGSVSTKIAEALQAQGFKTGLYTSPHISSFRERIRINGAMISENDVARMLEIIFPASPCATFFEITTLLAFLYFEENKVDYAVIETGLGGRLDATNIITPEVSIITSIGLDHKDILGNTLQEIANEKAGIIKPSVPVVIGPSVPLPHMIKIEEEFSTYDEENSALAKMALEILNISPQAIEIGIKKRPLCRFEIFHDRIILDAAHNPDGMNALIKMLDRYFPNQSVTFVVGFSKDKEIPSCLSILLPKARAFYLTEGDNPRKAETSLLQEYLKDLSFPEDRIKCGSLKDALEREGLIVATGSFFIMKQARKDLGIIEPQDPLNLNESFRSR